LEDDEIYRRRSSMADAEISEIISERARRRASTVCRVHQLLAEERHEKYAIRRAVEVSDDGPVDKASLLQAGPNGNIRSRHFSKQQLSDMTWGVRELAKKLSGIRLRLTVKSVFLLTKAHDESLIAHTRTLAAWLLSKDRDHPYLVYVCLIPRLPPLFEATRAHPGQLRREHSREQPHFQCKGAAGGKPIRPGSAQVLGRRDVCLEARDF
jgi:NAD+ kinase